MVSEFSPHRHAARRKHFEQRRVRQGAKREAPLQRRIGLTTSAAPASLLSCRAKSRHLSLRMIRDSSTALGMTELISATTAAPPENPAACDIRPAGIPN